MTTNASPPEAGNPAAPATKHLRFIELRAQGLSFARIATELGVSKPTLIDWSRKFQYEIDHLRAVELEALRDRHLVAVNDRLKSLADHSRRVEEELARRELLHTY